MDKDAKFKHLHRINYLTAEMDSLYHQASLKFGISDSVSLVLYTVCDLGDSCLLSDIYKNNGVSKQTVNSAIRKLEAEEILYLIPDKGRAKRVVLTEKGHDFVAHSVMKIMDAEIHAFDHWTQEEIETHVALMERYLEDFRKTLTKL